MRMNQHQELFWKLLEPEYRQAMMFCRKLMGSRDNGDDLYQDALVLAFTRFDSLKDHAAFRPWLYRILVNTFKSTVRRPWWKRRAALTPELAQGLIGDDPVDRFTARRWLDRAFAAIPPDDQALVTLYELEGWPLAELASLYGKTEGSLKVRLHRARRKMQQALLSAVPPDGDPAATAEKEKTWTAMKPETD
jgi:RNA polymerase sigma-70 factor (ECF subfamily)